MTEKDIHNINPHYDKDPRDFKMRSFGWRINPQGDWSMPAYEWIARNERRIIQKYSVNLGEGFVTEGIPEIDQPLTEALKGDLEMDSGRGRSR